MDATMNGLRPLPYFALAVVVAACSSSSSAPLGSSGSSGTTKDGGSEGGVPGPTFLAGVSPILNANCALAACHGSSASNLGIYIPYDPVQAYAELQKQSGTAKIPFVTPGDPKKSYLQ